MKTQHRNRIQDRAGVNESVITPLISSKVQLIDDLSIGSPGVRDTMLKLALLNSSYPKELLDNFLKFIRLYDKNHIIIGGTHGQSKKEKNKCPNRTPRRTVGKT